MSTGDDAKDPVELSYEGRDGLRVAAYRWDPAGEVRGIVQLTHGMGEHVRRYGHLAARLAGRGVVVYGQDHRGHGATARSDAELGQLGGDGWGGLVDDIDVLLTLARSEQPDRPLVLLGHSMGSFAAQQYLVDHSESLDGVVLTGTAALDLLEPALDLDSPLDLAAFNAPFAPARTDYEWLSRDPAQVDAYVADPRCGFGLDIPSVKAMFAAGRPLADPDRLAAVRADLPLYIAVGDADPVNAQLQLFHALVDRYRAAGLTDVTTKVYAGARHELFNETNREEVESDLVAWLDRVIV
ncbi:MAG: alpha/beta hydrolase [Acidimicrobiia bacterium]|nr:alpha/beta hydrolase [Acidimicrobiia bacterium]